MALQASKGKGSPAQKPGKTGCFICGSLEHDYRSCPKRGQSSSASSSAKPKPTCMVQPADDGQPCSSGLTQPQPPLSGPSAQDLQWLILAAGDSADPHRLRYAVVDAGATEIVGSLEAIEHIMRCRLGVFGHEQVCVDLQRTERLRFGNAQERWAESYLMLPQRVNGVDTSLGILHT